MEKLPDYLFEHLLESLRRDMRRQELDAIRNASNTQAATYHNANVRFSRQILQCLRPKQISLQYEEEHFLNRRECALEPG